MGQKLTRGVIKSIVKECLVEILEEGISNSGTSTLRESYDRKEKTQPQRRSSRSQKRAGLRIQSFLRFLLIQQRLRYKSREAQSQLGREAFQLLLQWQATEQLELLRSQHLKTFLENQLTNGQI